MANLLFLAAVYAALLYVTQIVCFLIGSCAMFIAFVEDISSDLTLLNDGYGKTKKQQQHWIERFFNTIQLYAQIKELSIRQATFDQFNFVAYFIHFSSLSTQINQRFQWHLRVHYNGQIHMVALDYFGFIVGNVVRLGQLYCTHCFFPFKFTYSLFIRIIQFRWGPMQIRSS